MGTFGMLQHVLHTMNMVKVAFNEPTWVIESLKPIILTHLFDLFMLFHRRSAVLRAVPQSWKLLVSESMRSEGKRKVNDL